MSSKKHLMRDAGLDLREADLTPDTPQTQSPAYRLAFADPDFLCQDALRPVRLQLELLKTEMGMDAEGIRSTIVLFGGARIPAPDATDGKPPAIAAMARYYEEARRFAYQITQRGARGENVIVTGGGPGVMEAGNRGAHEAGGVSVGLNIVLPHEQAPNAYVTPELSFNFHYFAIRKMHFLLRARALAIFPGGFGTMDELFESLTLIQTGRMEQVPVLLFGRDYWTRLVDWDMLVEIGTISPEDLDLFRFVETAEEALDVIDTWPLSGRRCGIPGR
ncbi:TIGR00730 family Rossman fold protein [Rhodobacterales bacterium HKCCA1058]|nr:TIGR00730 family Rossman fold protein [Rhodobacterales bacterium HKCCA1058]